MDKKNTPEVKLGQYKGLAVTRHVRPVTDKTVDIELVHQARMHAVYHPTTEPAKRGFRALLDFAGYMDGKVMSPAEIAAIADLPSKEGLVQMLLSVLVSGPRGLAIALSEVAKAQETA